MNVNHRPSPNFDSRDGHAIDMLVLHYTGMRNGAAAIDRLCDPSAKVSAHYVVELNGDIYRLVSESERAWHAGQSYWRGHTNINQRSIGIEIVNPGHEFGYRPFPEAQMQAVTHLCQEILQSYPSISPRNVVGHSDVAPARKEDPGELFEWVVLMEVGVGLWPEATERQVPADKLAEYGYDTSDMPKAITAFQRHFRQKNLSGQWDNECASLLAGLLALV